MLEKNKKGRGSHDKDEIGLDLRTLLKTKGAEPVALSKKEKGAELGRGLRALLKRHKRGGSCGLAQKRKRAGIEVLKRQKRRSFGFHKK